MFWGNVVTICNLPERGIAKEFVPINDYGYWSICWVCDEREQTYRLMESGGIRICKDCHAKEIF